MAGALIDIKDAEDDPILSVDDDDIGGLKARLNADVDGGNWGMQFGLAADMIGENDDASLYIYNAHGWSTILDMVTIRAGLIDPGVWVTDGWIDTNLSSGLGIRVEIHPMEGLNVGVFIPTPAGGDYIEDAIQGYGNEDGGMAFGFSYEQEDLFEVSAALRFRPSNEWDAYEEFAADILPMLHALAKITFNDPDLSYDDFLDGLKALMGLDDIEDEDDFVITAGFGYYGVPNLSIYAGLLVEYISSDADTKTSIGLNADYDVTEQLSAGLELGIVLWDGFFSFEFTPSVTYVLSEEISVGAGITGILAENFDEDIALASIGADLWAQYDIGNSYIKLGYGFTSTTEDFSPTGDSFVDHYIRLLFGYSF